MMEHATALLEQTLAPPPRQPDLGEPGFWRDFLWGMLKPAAATAVVALAVMLSFAQRLGIEAEMIYGVARSFVQLSLVGFVLHFIFVQKNATPWILLTYLFMVTVASYTAGQRAKQVPRGKYIAFVSILLGTVVNMALLLMLDVFPFTPRYIIPAAGMMVSNAMNVTGVTMKKLRDDVKIQKNLVHKEGLEELTDEDFLRQMGIGCEDNGLQLTQISELTANIDSKQGALPRDSEINIESYYKFDSNNESSTSIVNYNSYGQDIQTKEMNYMQLYEQQSSTPPPNYNSYGQEQQMQQHNVITSPGETSYVLSQGGSS